MTTINLTQDPELLRLFTQIVDDSSKISMHDTKLNQLVSNLMLISKAPEIIDCDILLDTMSTLAEYVESYEKTDLYSMIYLFLAKLHDFKLNSELKQKYFSVNAAADLFCKMACK